MNQPFADALILAGGRSSRMQVPKALLRHGDALWLDEQIHRLDAAGIARVRLVLGYHMERQLQEISWLADALDGEASLPGLSVRVKVQVLVNEVPYRGPFSSLKTGLQGFTGEAVWMTPVDAPVPPPAVFRAMAAALPGQAACQPEGPGGRGHPVLLGPEALAAIAGYGMDDPSARLDHILRSLGDRVTTVPVDAEVHGNINTPEDWQRYAGVRNASEYCR